MTQSLKIECLVTDLALEGEIVSFLVTKEQLTAGLSKKADLVDGKIKESNLPDFIANSFQTINRKLVTLEESIADGIQSAKDYSEAYTNEKLIVKADLVDGKVPQTQLPSVGQYEGLSEALNGVLDQARRDMIERTDEIQRTKADIGEDGKVVREQLPNYDKIPGLETVVTDLYDSKANAVDVETSFKESQDQLDAHSLLLQSLGSILPYNPSNTYEEGYVTLKDGSLQQLVSGKWVPFKINALNLVDLSGESQQQVNYNGGSKWHYRDGGYQENDRAVLDNGDIVKSTIDANLNDPNTNMAGWINIGNLIIVNTVTEMIGKKFKNGDVVKTLGYHNIFDGGGALYVISSTATDYSIPLNNGSHAVFNDTFDIRKFGILDNPNVDQDINLLRMTNYADTREYEIDFHNYAIRVPATALFTTDRGDTVRGIGFNKVHHLKNLNLKNNDTITQAAGLCCVGFYPKSEADCSGIFRVTNFKCDAQLTNYTGNNGAFDGFLIGFIAYPHPDWGYLMWNVANVPTMPIEFHFENIHFSTPAMSYNMSIANWKSRKIVLKNISGDYLGLYAHAFAHITDVSKVNVVYRKDLHTTMIPVRDLVTSAIHQEPELGTTGTAYVQSIKLADMHVVDSDGHRGLAYWHWSHGTLVINKFTAKDIYGYVSLTKTYAMGGKIGTLVADNVSGVDVVHNVDTMRLSRVQIIPYQRIKLRPTILSTIHTLTAAHVKHLIIEDSYIEGKLCAAYDEGTKVDNLIMRNCTFDSTDYFVTLATTMNVIIERVDTKISKRFLYARMPKLTIDGLQSYAIDVINFIKDDYADVSYAWDVSNLQSKATSGLVLNGDATIDIRHSVFNSKLEVAVLPTAKVSVSNTTVKPKTVNAGAVTVVSKGSYSASFAMPFVKLGDVLSYSSQVDLQGCTLNVYVKSDGNCTLSVYNGTNESLAFNPLAIYVWLNQSL